MSDEELQQMLNKVHHMDCIEFLRMLPDNSVDSCVTDPPYGLEFMGKEWDKVGTPREYQDWCMEWAKEVFRVLKPGAHLLAFSGTRTYHRLACAVEDAGFEIRDQIHWMYGSGFPKGKDISKAIDKKLGLKRERLGTKVELLGHGKKDGGLFHSDRPRKWIDDPEAEGHWVSLPASPEAECWQGWNTQLKPAHEPIVFARKPISEKSVAENVLKYGTGAINEGACKIAVSPDESTLRPIGKSPIQKIHSVVLSEAGKRTSVDSEYAGGHPSGRYPANLILSHHLDCRLIQEGRTEVRHTKRAATGTTGKGIYSDGWIRNPDEYSFDAGEPEVWQCVEGCPVRALNEQSGQRSGCRPHHIKSNIESYDGWGTITKQDRFFGYEDSGGAARFFYCSKPSVDERSAGLSERNVHITVKPIEIMRWLVRLVTQEGGTVLDPFLGSGTTAIAAENEGFKWLGCDNNDEYCEIANARIKALGGKRIGRKHDFSGWRRRRKIRKSSKSAEGVFG